VKCDTEDRSRVTQTDGIMGDSAGWDRIRGFGSKEESVTSKYLLRIMVNESRIDYAIA